MGQGLLNCFYVNNAQKYTCADGPVNNLGTRAAFSFASPQNGPQNIDPLVTAAGNSVTIAKGVFTSLVSQADAQEQAKDAALGQLQCQFGNQAAPNPDVMPEPCDSGSVGFDVQLPANVTFGTTQPQANMAAKTLANSLQQCTPDITPKNGKDGKSTNCDGKCFGYYA